MAEVDHVQVEGVDQHLIVDIDGSLRECEERVLTDVVLEPEVAQLFLLRELERV